MTKMSKKMERPSVKRSKEESDSDAWGCGSGSIEEVVVVDVCTDVSQRKTKRQKLIENSSSPIKTTQLADLDSSGYQYEQSSHSPLLKSKGVTAVMAMLINPTTTKASKYKSKYKKPKCYSIVAQMGTCGSIRKEHPNAFPTRLGRCQRHGARQMGTSTQREEVN